MSFRSLYKPERHTLLRATCCAAMVLVACAVNTVAQPAPAPAVESKSNHVGSIAELHNKQRALLMVFRSRVIDVENAERAIIDDVLKADPKPRGRYRWVYNDLARKLNKYIRKYGSMGSATDLADAEYVIFFNVVEFRRILNAIYPFGELFIIVKGSPQESKPPRIVWRAKKVMEGTEAIGDLIRALKTLRGET